MGKEKKYSVLVVDDSDINRDILNTILSADFKIYEAADGVQALEIMRDSRKKIDLCLLDIMMPRMDGYEVLSVMNKDHIIDYIPERTGNEKEMDGMSSCERARARTLCLRRQQGYRESGRYGGRGCRGAGSRRADGGA